MGLDMYAFITADKLASEVDFPEAKAVQLHYWRKHPNLHGWMQLLYIEKGGREKNFNWSPVALNSADLDRLEAAVIADELPLTTGFFFGESNWRERKDDDLAFIAKARKALASGKMVFYIGDW